MALYKLMGGKTRRVKVKKLTYLFLAITVSLIGSGNGVCGRFYLDQPNDHSVTDDIKIGHAMVSAHGLGFAQGAGEVHATLIAPRIAVCAAHAMGEGFNYAGQKITVNGKEARVIHVVKRHGFDPDTLDNDIGLLFLDRDLGPFPKIYGAEAGETFDALDGQWAIIISRGPVKAAKSGDPLSHSFHMMRNRLSAVRLGIQCHLSVTGIADSDPAPGHDKFRAVPIGGDSSAPVYVYKDGQYKLVGVVSGVGGGFYGSAFVPTATITPLVCHYNEFLLPNING